MVLYIRMRTVEFESDSVPVRRSAPSQPIGLVTKIVMAGSRGMIQTAGQALLFEIVFIIVAVVLFIYLLSGGGGVSKPLTPELINAPQPAHPL